LPPFLGQSLLLAPEVAQKATSGPSGETPLARRPAQDCAAKSPSQRPIGAISAGRTSPHFCAHFRFAAFSTIRT